MRSTRTKRPPRGKPRTERSARTERPARGSSFEAKRGDGRRDSRGSGPKKQTAAQKRRSRPGRWGDSAFLPRANEKGALPKPIRRVPTERVDTLASGSASERLQKVISRAGVASRRHAEQMILEGRVKVNGKTVVELGTKVNPEKDRIMVDGKILDRMTEAMYIAFYKPKGMISALSDPEGRPHLGQLVDKLGKRVVPVGRLDFNSEGLILLTNDGDLANALLKAREVPKVYMVKIKGHPEPGALEFMKRQLFTPEGVLRFGSFGVEQRLENKTWLRVEVIEGAGLDLKELLNRRGVMVDRIIRTAIGPINVQGLSPGDFEILSKKDFEAVLATKPQSERR